MEYESLEDIYTYYDNKIKIMNRLDKKKLDEIEANRRAEVEIQDDDDEEELTNVDKPTKKVDRKNDVEIHTELTGSLRKESAEKSNKAAPVQQSARKGSASKSQTPVQVVQNTGSKKDSYLESIKEISSKKVTSQGVEDQVTTIKSVTKNGQEKMVVEDTTSALQKESGEIVLQQLHTQVVTSPQDGGVMVIEENEVVVIGGSDDEDIGGMPMLDLEADADE